MGREATKATGNPWFEARKRASMYDDRLCSREGAAERLGILNNDNDDRRQFFETCSLQHKAVCNPIVDWTDNDVWDYIHAENIPINPLYSCGFLRVGCIGCPMAGTKGRYWEFSRYPAYKKLYIRAFERMLEERQRRGKMQGTWKTGTTGEDVFHWWMEDGILPGQISITDLTEDTEG